MVLNFTMCAGDSKGNITGLFFTAIKCILAAAYTLHQNSQSNICWSANDECSGISEITWHGNQRAKRDLRRQGVREEVHESQHEKAAIPTIGLQGYEVGLLHTPVRGILPSEQTHPEVLVRCCHWSCVFCTLPSGGDVMESVHDARIQGQGNRGSTLHHRAN